jgi:hypothetical protein
MKALDHIDEVLSREEAMLSRDSTIDTAGEVSQRFTGGAYKERAQKAWAWAQSKKATLGDDMARRAAGAAAWAAGKAVAGGQLTWRGAKWVGTKIKKHKVMLVKLAVGATLVTVSIAFPPAGLAAVALGGVGVAWNIGWAMRDAYQSKKACNDKLTGADKAGGTTCKINKCKAKWLVARQIVVNGVTLSCGVPFDVDTGASLAADSLDASQKALGDAANYVGAADAGEGSLQDANGAANVTRAQAIVKKIADAKPKFFKCDKGKELYVPVKATVLAGKPVGATDEEMCEADPEEKAVPSTVEIDGTVDEGDCVADKNMEGAGEDDGTDAATDSTDCMGADSTSR